VKEIPLAVLAMAHNATEQEYTFFEHFGFVELTFSYGYYNISDSL